MRSTHNRAILAERAASTSRLPGNPRPKPSTPGTNPGMRAQTLVHGTGHVKKTRCAPMTAAQRDSTGKRSDWSRSPEFFTDPKWGRTLADGINP